MARSSSSKPFPTNPINALEARKRPYPYGSHTFKFPTNPINALEARVHEDSYVSLMVDGDEFPTNPINALEAS